MNTNHSIWSCVLISFLIGTACSPADEQAAEEETRANASVRFNLTTATPSIPNHTSRTRLLIAERSVDHTSATDGGLYCAPANRYWLTENSFQAKGLKLQWYQFAFLRVPDQINGTETGTGQPITVHAEELFSDLQSHASTQDRTTCQFTQLKVDYSRVWQLQEKDYTSSTRYDLHIYRGGLQRWMVRPDKNQPTVPTEDVTLKRVTGELKLNMGVLPDQFEHRVEQIILTARIPMQMYISAPHANNPENQPIVDETTAEERSYTYVVPESLSQATCKEPCILTFTLLPCQLHGTLTVRFKGTGQQAAPQEEVYTIRTGGEMPAVQIKPNVRTNLLFNGMYKNEFEIRYAGFDGSGIEIAPDQWNGGW